MSITVADIRREVKEKNVTFILTWIHGLFSLGEMKMAVSQD